MSRSKRKRAHFVTRSKFPKPLPGLSHRMGSLELLYRLRTARISRMKRSPSIHTLILLCLVATPAFADSTATTPAPRTNPKNWMARHDGFVAEAQRGGIDLLFLGDSITDFWRRQGSNVWEKYYTPRHAANFGISGDRTEHVLWRIEHGELEAL